MPKVAVTLSNIDQTVTRPVIYSIIEQLQTITKIKKNSLIIYPGDSGINATPGSTIETDKNNEALFNASNIVHIEVTIEHDENSIDTTDAFGIHTYPIFKDSNLKVYITPIYSKVNVVINFTYNTPSKTEAQRWRDDLRIKLSQMRDVNLHSVDYSYTLPLSYLVLLKHIHTLRENIAGYNETFTEYLMLNSVNTLTLITDTSGIDTSLTIAEKQSRIVGLYDFAPLPDIPEKDNDKSIWKVNFNYKFSFDKPVSAAMIYPITVHNQSLPVRYVDFNEDDINLNRKNLVTLNDLRYFEYDSIYNRIMPDKLFIRIPEFDDFKIDQLIKGSGTVFLALCELNLDNPKLLLNLDELGEVCLDKDILDFIRAGEYRYICKPQHSILHLSLYRNNGLLEYESISCNSDLDIYMRAEPDIRKQYRVRLSIMCDLSLLSMESLIRLKKYPKAFTKIISGINELLAVHPDMNKLSDKRYIENYELSVIYRLLTGSALNQSGGLGSGHYFGSGMSASSISGRYELLKDIDPKIVKKFTDNTIKLNTVMVSAIMALKRTDGV
jgi:hypothetical protein